MMLGMNFIGLSYLLVYVGAVSILFLFILMLTNIRISELTTDSSNSIPLAMIGIFFNNTRIWYYIFSFGLFLVIYVCLIGTAYAEPPLPRLDHLGFSSAEYFRTWRYLLAYHDYVYRYKSPILPVFLGDLPNTMPPEQKCVLTVFIAHFYPELAYNNLGVAVFERYGVTSPILEEIRSRGFISKPLL